MASHWQSVFCILCVVHLSYSYYLSPNKLSHPDANNYCIQQCGSVLSNGPVSADSYNFVTILSQHTLMIDSDTDIWTGFHYDTTNGWVWPDGTALSGWSSAETSCGAISMTGNQYSMESEDCSVQHRFLCNHCYAVINKYILIETQLTLDASELHCNTNFDTSLASLHNKDNDHDSVILLCSTARNNDACWLGATDRVGLHTFEWTDGTQFDYGVDGQTYTTPPWFANEPNNAHDNEFGYQDCVHVFTYPSAATPYYFDDDYCTKVHNFICAMPSQLCNDENNWKYIHSVYGGEWIELAQCSLNGVNNNIATVIPEGFSYAILSNIQTINNNVVVAELTFKINVIYNVGYIGLIFNVTSTYDYYFAGIATTGTATDRLVLFRISNGVMFDYLEQPVTIQPRSGVYWTMIVTLTDTAISLKFNNVVGVLSTSITHSFFTFAEGCPGCYYSGYIGIAIHNIDITAKTLYFSGASMDIASYPQFDISSFTLSPTTTPSQQPTNAPTPPTYSPSQPPTNYPSNSPSQPPTWFPTNYPSNAPTYSPTLFPSNAPSDSPTDYPSNYPSNSPTFAPSYGADQEVGIRTTAETLSEVDEESLLANGQNLMVFIIVIIILLLCCVVIILCTQMFVVKAKRKVRAKEDIIVVPESNTMDIANAMAMKKKSGEMEIALKRNTGKHKMLQMSAVTSYSANNEHVDAVLSITDNVFQHDIDDNNDEALYDSDEALYGDNITAGTNSPK